MSEATYDAIALEFFDALWPDLPEGAAILVWTLPDHRSHWHRSTAAAAACAVLLAAQCDVYTMVSLAPPGLSAKQRGKAEQMVALCGLWLEVDIAGPGHAGKEYAPTEEAALDLLYYDDLPAPTIVNHSGGGLHAWWLFKEPWVFADEGEREAAAALATRWQALYRQRAHAKGYTFDATQDLTRVLRVPGTFNRKLADNIRPVRRLQSTDVRLDPSDLQELLADMDAALAFEAPTTKAPDRPTQDKVVSIDAPKPKGKFDFALRPTGEVATVDLRALNERFPKAFLPLWNNTRDGFTSGKNSQSEHDMSLANLAALANWPDQRIVDLLVHHRRLRTGKGPKHISYYERTLKKARFYAESVARPTEANASTEPPEDWFSPDDDDAPAPPSKDSKGQKQDIKEWARSVISDKLKTKVLRLVKVGRHDPSYRLETEIGDVIFNSAEELTSQRTFRTRAAGSLDKILPHMKDADWPKFLRTLMELITNEQADQDSDLAGSTIHWLMRYLSDVAVLENWDSSRHLKSTDPVQTAHKDEGAIWINATDFRTWVNKTLNESVTQKAMAIRLKLIGGETKRREIRKPRTTIWFWRLPPEEFDPSDYPIRAPDELDPDAETTPMEVPEGGYVV